MAPKKRAASSSTDESATAAQAKKYKSAIDEVAEEYLCPITSELPLDPVIAEDGKIYERTAIEAHIRAKGADLKSPLTNLPMGPRLIASTQVKNSIEKLVRSGAISGDKAEQWLERLSDEEVVKKTIREAEGGDVDAIYDLVFWYRNGKHGLAEDREASYRWTEKAALLRHPPCLALAGTLLVEGEIVKRNAVKGITWLTQGALEGSNFGAYTLGQMYHTGLLGSRAAAVVPVDKSEALYWYRLAISERSDHDDIDETAIQYCRDQVKKLEEKLGA